MDTRLSLFDELDKAIDSVCEEGGVDNLHKVIEKIAPTPPMEETRRIEKVGGRGGRRRKSGSYNFGF